MLWMLLECNTTITIFNPETGQSVDAIIVDTCPGCKTYDVDATQSLFQKLAPNGDGKVHGIDWGGNMVGG